MPIEYLLRKSIIPPLWQGPVVLPHNLCVGAGELRV